MMTQGAKVTLTKQILNKIYDRQKTFFECFVPTAHISLSN